MVFRFNKSEGVFEGVRTTFLGSFWKRYPSLPEGWFMGEIQEIDYVFRTKKTKEHEDQDSVEASLNFKFKNGDSYLKKLFFECLNYCEDESVIEFILAQKSCADANVDAEILMFLSLRIGDWVGYSREKTIEHSFSLLSPCLDLKLKSKADRNTIVKWNHFLTAIREYFTGQNFVEVRTPSLVSCPGTEPHIQFFSTEFKMGNGQKKYFLPSSPELHLKKALSLGFEKVFELKECFRNGEVSPHHQPEFLMLEWYRAGQSLDSIEKDISDLIQFIFKKDMFASVPAISMPHFSMQHLFKKYLDFDLSPHTTFEELLQFVKKSTNIFINEKSYDNFDDLFNLLFVEVIEAKLFAENEGPFFINKYPPSQAAYARIGADGWAERFEFYWNGLEIGNAFHEVNDPELQLSRMRSDLEKKHDIEKWKTEKQKTDFLGADFVTQFDEEFIQALRAGMPPSSGIAVGVERLFMAMSGIAEIGRTRLFEFKHH